MKLVKLLEDVRYKGVVVDSEISFLTCNSKEVKKGCLFACLKGENVDGHDYAKEAVSSGAVAILVEKDMGLPNQLLVDDTHKAFGKICANFYGNPAKRLKFIGVTGTNGKTTVTKIVKNVLEKENKKVGLIGTIQNEIASKVIATEKTTPDHVNYQMLIKEMADEGCEYVVMEVSSHALEQSRIADTHFEVGVFTNLTQEHLDYHATMENYYQAKKKLFDVSDCSVVCVDDEYGKRLSEEIDKKVITFTAKDFSANFKAEDIKMDVEGVDFRLVGEGLDEKIHFSTPGLFSVHNAMTAELVCIALGFDAKKSAASIASCKPIKGRSERIPTKRDFHIICDYAHSPDGLKNILDSIHSYNKGRIVALFGCGGDRDKTKRPIMGEVAAKNADFLIVTSDNPRTEDPDSIIDDIMVGVEKTKTPYIRITDRKEAIKYAIENAKTDDIILLAGKGHEDYQVIGKEKIDFDERDVVRDILESLDR
ncbi:MAG: UDP-N-acetylmuramoyl-L-alanyl-D-glutamate--2,6-diaminopimelate ligase [Oscillospiraceae bacterium]|nr:UDP-N-acetylmuramoyl-L-alanyl-D-glutamate--2,6-diaminopimelate ligase [Oscillospiraceae bacterium]MDE5852868.1 UDP-N-acetylmuramoyl-L-alanyl-D-glutamate--2,6-diaminopimelate ligase [Oscillospiraceae bacterium]